MSTKKCVGALLGVALGLCAFAGQLSAQTEIYDTGGLLMPEQAAYDVTFYDLDLEVSPADSSIAGSVRVEADIVQPLEWFVLDLDTLLAIDSVSSVAQDGETNALDFERREGKIWAAFPTMKQPGDKVSIEVAYGGQPRVAPNPPWSGGFSWEETPSGEPWIATSCQQEGADLWWPVKDHVSDKPDSMAIQITVPEPLVVASNGTLEEVKSNENGTETYHWFISTPISTYNVALNIAPYRVIEDTYESVAGDRFPVKFWVLPEHYEEGEAFFPEIIDHLQWYEDLLGPYPFRADKYGVAHTPHLGMEHQSIIAYGADFDNTAMTGGVDWGYDALHHHELAHEWWGNLVTNADWRDMWIHEGFGSYMQALYAEHLNGEEAYHNYVESFRGGVQNEYPIAPPDVQTGKEIYQADIYAKGAAVLHTLRYLMGDEAFFDTLRRMAYPDPSLEEMTGGEQVRFVTTRDFITIAEEVAGTELAWFFEVYVRQADLPQLVSEQEGDTLTLEWGVPGDLPFPMPVEVRLGDETQRVDMPEGQATISVPEGLTPEVDPQRWILKEEG